eukprot:scaffold98623_cov99-Phaeocystis_antarctica.AAC.3
MGAKLITLQPSLINTGAGGFGAHPGAHGELATRAPRELGPDDKVELARTLPRGAQLEDVTGCTGRLKLRLGLSQTPPLCGPPSFQHATHAQRSHCSRAGPSCSVLRACSATKPASPPDIASSCAARWTTVSPSSPGAAAGAARPGAPRPARRPWASAWEAESVGVRVRWAGRLEVRARQGFEGGAPELEVLREVAERVVRPHHPPVGGEDGVEVGITVPREEAAHAGAHVVPHLPDEEDGLLLVGLARLLVRRAIEA